MNRKEFIAKALGVGTAMSVANTISLAKASGLASSIAERDRINVACAISAGTTDIDWVGPCAAFETWHFDPVEKKYKPKFKIYTVSETLQPVDGRIPDYTFKTAPAPEIIVVPAQSGSDALTEWLTQMEKQAGLIMSVCIGARHLAKAGLLDGMTATTHHESIDRFIKDFPTVTWIKGVRFVENGKICTGGGLTAGIDLGLRVVERYFGRDSALKVADHLEYEGKGWIVN